MHRILFIGKGGEGVQFAAKLFAQTMINNNHEATLITSYGPEARGAMSKCVVCIDTKQINEPIHNEFDILVAFNQDARSEHNSKTIKQAFCFPGESNVLYVKWLLKFFNVNPKKAIPILELMSKRNLKENIEMLEN